MRILVTGSQGQVVSALVERASRLEDVQLAALGRPTLDLARPETLAYAFKDVPFDVLVNTAAYTAVDKAESEEDVAQRINAEAAGVLARIAAERAAPIIQISTDYVFDGAKDGAWTEDDSTGPLSAYGRTKLAGEKSVLSNNPTAVVLRTAWVYSPFGANFARTMLRLAESRSELSVVDDQTGAPTNALDIADGILAVARNLVASPDDPTLFGTFHMTAGVNSPPPTWADFAVAIFEASSFVGGPSATVRRISTAEYPTPATRPRNSLLDCRKLAVSHGVQLPLWSNSVGPTVQRIVQQARSGDEAGNSGTPDAFRNM